MNPLYLGISGGLIWGISFFIMNWACIAFGYGKKFLEIFEELYLGYQISALGSFVGFFYAFLDMFVFLFLLIWLHDLLQKYIRPKKKGPFNL